MFLMASSPVVLSSYSTSSTFICLPPTFRPPRLFTSSIQSLMFGQCVTAAPPASGPVFGALAPIFNVS